MLLSVRGLQVYIGSSLILDDISLEIGKGGLLFVIGRNGAGKTTLLRTVMGYLKPQKGVLRFRDEDIVNKKPFEISRLGIGYSPEDSGIFPDLTVTENMEVSTYFRSTNKSPKERIELAYKIFPALKNYAERKGDHLSGGEKKMLSVARALATDPELLLLDEPFEGLAPILITKLQDSIKEIAKIGLALVITESNINHIPDFADRICVIERGEIIFMGSPEQMRKEDDVMKVITGKIE